MISLFVAAAAGAAALMGQNNPPVAQIDPLIGRPLERVRDTADLHAQVRSEVRDEKWANQTEAAMRPRLLRLPLVGKEGNELRINCGSTLCEIGGSLAGTATDPYDPKQPLNQAVADLQAKPLSDDLAKLGLKHVSGLFTGGEGKPDRVVFLLYYSRAQ